MPGNRTVIGTVQAIRGGQIEVDIGHPQPLFLPLKPGLDKDQTIREGDSIEITMNDHNAVVDYHPSRDRDRAHTVLHGRISEPLTVGHDKAILQTQEGERGYAVASRARSKLSAIPVGVDALFLLDETGQIVDAQLAGEQAEDQPGLKPPIKGAHRRIEAIHLGTPDQEHIRVRLSKDGSEREFPVRTPIQKLDTLKDNEPVILLVDSKGYVVEIATPEHPSR